MDWISVKDRLPEDDFPKDTKKLQNRIRQYCSWKCDGVFTDWYWRHSAGRVTHWMPLPEPPEEKRNDIQ